MGMHFPQLTLLLSDFTDTGTCVHARRIPGGGVGAPRTYAMIDKQLMQKGSPNR